MFVRIHHDDLVIGKKYNIDHNYKGIFKGPIMIEIPCLDFDYTWMNGTRDAPGFCFSTRHNFYEWVPQKERIQWNMERRAVNIILRRVIGDEHFTW